MNRIVLVILLISIFTACALQENELAKSNISYVDPFIGTGYHGHTFPGASLPFGMIQLSPDTRTLGWDACSGYHYSDSSILGFSHTHLSGTGIGDYGDVLFMPYTGEVSIEAGTPEDPDSGYRSRFSHSSESASPGYYKVELDDYNIKVELTASERVGFHRYTFPEADEAGILIDLSHTIHGHQNPVNHIKVINEYEIEGLKQTRGWAANHYAYFRAKFSKPFEIELFSNNVKVEGKEISGNNVRAKLKFSTKTDEVVRAKVAISGVDNEGALLNLENEIPDWDFNHVVEDAKEKWCEQLNKIEVSGDSEADKRIFYTSLYHSNLSPTIYSDIDGRYRGMDGNIYQSENKNYTVYSLWDTYRAQHPLFTIIKPEYNQDLIRALLRKYKEGGILPKWELASNYTGTMIGSHAVSVIVDSYMKGQRDFDANLALEAIINSVEYDTTRTIYYSKESVKEKLMPRAKSLVDEYGYVPADLENKSVSKALEFAFNYWCVAVMAEDMGKTEIAEKYFKKSNTYKAYFDKETGFMRGKLADGTWVEPFDPAYSNHGSGQYVEGNAWQWSWYVPQDVEGLIALYGSKEKFGAQLDLLFSTSSEVSGEHASSDITGLIGQYAHGNEPSHHIAYLYNYAEMPWKTQEIVTRITSEFYDDTPEGICGNEDCGQMSAWYILNAMGFYPVCPGSNKYQIGKPLFERVAIHLENGNVFEVKARKLSEDNQYVENVLLDGKQLKEPYILHDDISQGKKLEFIMGKEKKVFWKE